jgi:hypothetical protein
VVEDSGPGIAAGMTVVALLGERPEERIPDGVRVVRSLSELHGIIQSGLQRPFALVIGTDGRPARRTISQHEHQHSCCAPPHGGGAFPWCPP